MHAKGRRKMNRSHYNNEMNLLNSNVRASQTITQFMPAPDTQVYTDMTQRISKSRISGARQSDYANSVHRYAAERNNDPANLDIDYY